MIEQINEGFVRTQIYDMMEKMSLDIDVLIEHAKEIADHTLVVKLSTIQTMLTNEN